MFPLMIGTWVFVFNLSTAQLQRYSFFKFCHSHSFKIYKVKSFNLINFELSFNLKLYLKVYIYIYVCMYVCMYDGINIELYSVRVFYTFNECSFILLMICIAFLYATLSGMPSGVTVL